MAATVRRTCAVLTMVLAAAVVPPCVSAQTRVVAVTALPDGAAQLTLANGRKIAIPKEPG